MPTFPHQEMCRYIAKMGAFYKNGDRTRARIHAHELVKHLQKLDLIPNGTFLSIPLCPITDSKDSQGKKVREGKEA